MALTHPAITNFSGGQVSDLMAARVDAEAYTTMVDTLENMHVQKQGGIIKRPGTEYIGSVVTPANNARLIPFEFSTTQAYILEFADQTMRVYMNGGIVLSGISPYSLVTPYTDDQLEDLKFVQGADTMFIVHPAHMPYELTRTAHNAWTITAMVPEWGPFLDENESAITITPSAVTGVGITLTASAATFSYGNAGFAAGHIGSFWKFTGPKTEAANISAHATWTSALSLDAGETIVVSISGTWVANVTLQRSFDGGSTWLDYIIYTSNASTEVIEARDSVSYRIGVDTGDYTSGTANVSITLPEETGYAKITAVADTTHATATVIETLPMATATTRWAEGSWSILRGFPKAIAFYELRLVFAGTNTHPQTIWGSQVDDFTNFKAGTESSDAWTYQLAAERVNSIVSMVSSDVLYIFTVGGEWRLGSKSTATTPTSVEVKQETAYGSINSQAQKSGHVVFFPHWAGKSIRMMVYNYRIDGWETHDVSFVAEDLFSGGSADIKELIITSEPTDTIWIRRDDGKLVLCNFDLSNGTFAYSQINLGGVEDVESIASIPGSDADEVWILVKRTIDGDVVRYIERFVSNIGVSIESQCFLDCALSFSGSDLTGVSGLDHLEGETVSIVGDGATHADKVVSSGEIVFDRTMDDGWVGYSYSAIVRTLKLEVKREDGTAQTRPIDSIDVSVRLNNTIGMEVSSDNSTFDVVPFRTPAMEMDAGVDLFTGDTEQIELDAVDDGRSTQITLRNSYPLPFNVLGIFPTLKT